MEVSKNKLQHWATILLTFYFVNNGLKKVFMNYTETEQFDDAIY